MGGVGVNVAGGRSGGGGGRGLLSLGLSGNLYFLIKWRQAKSHVPHLDSDLQTEPTGCYQNLRVLVAGCREEKTPRKQLPVFVCFFPDGVSKEEESPWRGINRKERLFVNDERAAGSEVYLCTFGGRILTPPKIHKRTKSQVFPFSSSFLQPGRESESHPANEIFPDDLVLRE